MQKLLLSKGMQIVGEVVFSKSKGLD